MLVVLLVIVRVVVDTCDVSDLEGTGIGCCLHAPTSTDIGGVVVSSI